MNRCDRPHVYVPYPELVEREPGGAPYEIRDALGEPLSTKGMVDLGKRVMWVPLEPGARAVSRHELGHVAFSPLRAAQVRFDARLLMAVEDARVNLALAGLGIPVELDAEGHAQVVMLLAQDAKRRDGFALFVRSIASVGTSVEEAVESQLLAAPGPLGALVVRWMGRVRGDLEEARALARRPVAPYAIGVALARELARELRALGLLDANLKARSRILLDCCVGPRCDGDGLPERPHPRHVDPRSGDEQGAVEPGRLTVKAAPLSVPLRPGQGGGRGWRAASEGSVVRYLARWPVDGAVFRRRARRGGGTVLVDNSGSMALEVADLDRLLLSTPHGMRVAVYSGSGAEGELRVVADGVRRAAPEHLARFGGGNVVDLPALEWLARQPLPRLWVSDGGVTGVGDRGSLALKQRCAAVCRRARIRRVAKIDDAVALLKGGTSAA
jgi:hypothetical protein